MSTEETIPTQPTVAPPVTMSTPNPPPVQPPATAPAPAPGYKAIVTTDSCPICMGLKDYLQKKGLTDKVKIINASTPEGRKFADEHGIRGVPECILVAEDGKSIRVCTKEEFEKVLTDGS